MAEHILIDGYNVIHSLVDSKKTLAFGVNASAQIFIQEASKLLSIVDRVTLVFDGNDVKSTVDYPYRGRRFCVIYSDLNTTADTLIEQMVRKSKARIDCTVVTNDHGLSNTVRALGGIIMSAKEFSSMISKDEYSYGKRTIAGDNGEPFGTKLFK
ncbi:MAG: NYN domain-containing protein [Puniceicoccales bacterium]|nr:NYN domain-containing protein [Puniceicoccales bacterium]